MIPVATPTCPDCSGEGAVERTLRGVDVEVACRCALHCTRCDRMIDPYCVRWIAWARFADGREYRSRPMCRTCAGQTSDNLLRLSVTVTGGVYDTDGKKP